MNVTFGFIIQNITYYKMQRHDIYGKKMYLGEKNLNLITLFSYSCNCPSLAMPKSFEIQGVLRKGCEKY